MFKKLINKFAMYLLNATKVSTHGVIITGNEKVAYKAKGVKVHGGAKINSLSLAWKDVPAEEKQTDLELIQSEIIVKGYKAIPEILAQYRNEMVQHFVMIQLIQLGQYNPEADVLDSYSIPQLIAMALDNNQLMFEQRMFETGKANITANQITMLKKNGVSDLEMPKDRFSASRLIDKILKSKGIDTSKPRTNTPSVNQVQTIIKLTTKLGITIMPTYSTGSEASAVIGNLIEQCELAGIVEKASEKQIELAKQLTKKLNKRWTAKRELAVSSMSKTEVSKEIATMYDDLNRLHPEATEGQISYILQLMQQLNIPHNVSEVKAMTRVQATAQLEVLRLSYAYLLTRATNPSLTKETLKAMSKDAIKSLIDTIKHETKTRDLTRDSEFDTKMSLEC